MSKVKIGIWNINSVRVRVNHLFDCINRESLDVVLLQETKCQNSDFPFVEFASRGFNYAISGQKSYNGVAIISKHPIEIEMTKLPLYDIEKNDEEARYIEGLVTIGKNVLRLASVYVPNGAQLLQNGTKLEESERFLYKLKFYQRLQKRLEEIKKFDEMVLIGGDFNVARSRIDLHSPDKENGHIGFHPMERSHLESLIECGFDDIFRTLHKEKAGYTWWDYRTAAFKKGLGWRIDYGLVSESLQKHATSCYVDLETRGMDKTSDHAPLVCEFNL
ncbi:MAG: Exodeoxyribonuclease [Pseudomonadota bacterium]|jgi:exodeoxyribonuclease-3